MQDIGRELYLFEGFALDLTRGSLRGADGEIELRPKNFELLRYLVQNAGRLISKDELINAVWPKVIVGDDSLAQCVSDLRQALNDPERRIIKTVPRRGYLFAATVAVQPRRSELGPPFAGFSDIVEQEYSAAASIAPAPAIPGQQGHMTATRRLAAILAADVVGYSRLIGADEGGTLRALKEIRTDLFDPTIATHKGRLVKTTGDGLLVEFSSVVDALRCATQLQERLVEHSASLPAERRIEFRMGIHQGDVVVEDGDLFGDGVNVAVRLEGLAEPGGICVSARVQEDAVGKLELIFEDLGEQQLKNISRRVRVHRVLVGGAGPRTAATDTEPPWPKMVLPLPDKPSIAVLPFENMTGDLDQDYFVDGTVEEIITAISRIPWLFVIARNSSFTYKGRAVDVTRVARELGVRYLLEGSVRKAGPRVRISGQLIDTTTTAHIWADRFDGSLGDIFEIQEQVASSVVGAIEPRLRLSEIHRATRKAADSLDAYDLYLRALSRLHKFSEQDCDQAISLVRRGLAIEPSYAPAAAMIGWCRVHQVTMAWGRISEADLRESTYLAKQALEAANDDPDVLWMAGFTLLIIGGEHAIAETVINRALALNPNSTYALLASGWVSCFRNQPARAIQTLERAMRLSPLDRMGYRFSGCLGLAHLVAGQYEEAIEWADRSLREQPRYTVAIRMKVVLCAHMGHIDEARTWLGRLLLVQPGLTIAKYKRLVRYFPPEIQAVYVEGFRKAGLPES
jgi:TolB-like protein/class 3 adenylate cyclase